MNRASFTAISFLLNSQFGVKKKINTDLIQLLLAPDYMIDCRKYYAQKRTLSMGKILAINGLAIDGYLDERMVRVCKSLAACGFEVYSPAYYELNHLTISRKSIEDISLTIPALVKQSQDSGVQKVALFAPSFAGGMALIAASKPEISHMVSAICTVGAYANTRQSITYALEGEDNDDYGRLVLMWNFINQATSQFPNIREALKEAILDNGLPRIPPKLPEFLSSYTEEERQHIIHLIRQKDYRMKFWEKVVEMDRQGEHLMEHFDVLPKISNMKAPVSLVHGKTDTVIPAYESEKLFNFLTQNGVEARLVITPFISHGDTGFQWNLLKEVWKMAKVFTFYFRHAIT